MIELPGNMHSCAVRDMQRPSDYETRADLDYYYSELSYLREWALQNRDEGKTPRQARIMRVDE